MCNNELVYFPTVVEILTSNVESIIECDFQNLQERQILMLKSNISSIYAETVLRITDEGS